MSGDRVRLGWLLSEQTHIGLGNAVTNNGNDAPSAESTSSNDPIALRFAAAESERERAPWVGPLALI